MTTPTAKTITRFHRYDELAVPSSKRLVTVYYEYNRETKTLTYGCSVFRKSKPSDSFNHKAHNATARGRFTVRPMTLNDVEDNGTLEEFHAKLRDLIGTNFSGARVVKGRRKRNTQEVN